MVTTKTKWGVFIALSCILIALVFVVITQKNTINNLKIDVNQKEQNIKSLNDSVRITKEKNGALTYSKGVLILENDALKKLKPETYDKVKKIDGKVSEYNEIVGSLKDETERKATSSKVDVQTTNDSDIYTHLWSYDTIYNKNNYLHISGESELIKKGSDFIGRTKITKTDLGFNVIQGIREKNGLIEVFAYSDNPNFSVSDINSVIINPKEHVAKEFILPKKHKWNVSAIAGYGIGDKFRPTYFIGVGFGKTIFTF